MGARAKKKTKKAKRVKISASKLDQLPADRLFRLAEAAESIADNLRALAVPNPEDWLIKSVRDWYEMTGRELRSLGLLD